MQIPGGWLGNIYGGKLVMTLSILGSSLFTLVLPFCTQEIALLLCCRVLTGFFEGALYPITYHYLGLWFPESEKGSASGLVGTAAPIGIMLAFMASPPIIENLGWESIFWITGAVGIIFTVLWILVARNSPQDTESVSCLKISAVEESLLVTEKMTSSIPSYVPWKPIFKSLAVQAFALNLFAYNWVKYITISWIPIYLSEDLKFELSSTGLYSLLPYLVGSILTFLSGKIADGVIERGYMSTVNTRKFCQFLGLVLPSAGLILMSFVETTPIQTVTIMIAAVGATGFTGGGFIPNAIDLSHQYSGIIYAYGNTLGNVPGFVGVYVTGEILRLTDRDWSVVWLLAIGINVVALIVCFIFFKGEEIPFNEQDI